MDTESSSIHVSKINFVLHMSMTVHLHMIFMNHMLLTDFIFALFRKIQRQTHSSYGNLCALTVIVILNRMIDL